MIFEDENLSRLLHINSWMFFSLLCSLWNQGRKMMWLKVKLRQNLQNPEKTPDEIKSRNPSKSASLNLFESIESIWIDWIYLNRLNLLNLGIKSRQVPKGMWVAIHHCLSEYVQGPNVDDLRKSTLYLFNTVQNQITKCHLEPCHLPYQELKDPDLTSS